MHDQFLLEAFGQFEQRNRLSNPGNPMKDVRMEEIRNRFEFESGQSLVQADM